MGFTFEQVAIPRTFLIKPGSTNCLGENAFEQIGAVKRTCPPPFGKYPRF